jgi:hypothetical protein
MPKLTAAQRRTLFDNLTPAQLNDVRRHMRRDIREWRQLVADLEPVKGKPSMLALYSGMVGPEYLARMKRTLKKAQAGLARFDADYPRNGK